MNVITKLSVSQLRRAVNLMEQIETLQKELMLLGSRIKTARVKVPKKEKRFRSAGRARIAGRQKLAFKTRSALKAKMRSVARARWAKVKPRTGDSNTTGPRRMDP
jgi:hypothetical protein